MKNSIKIAVLLGICSLGYLQALNPWAAFSIKTASAVTGAAAGAVAGPAALMAGLELTTPSTADNADKVEVFNYFIALAAGIPIGGAFGGKLGFKAAQSIIRQYTVQQMAHGTRKYYRIK